MEMPKRKYFAMIAVAGFVIAFIEPIILLLLAMIWEVPSGLWQSGHWNLLCILEKIEV